MKSIKNIALVAHDNKKKDIIEWVRWNCLSLLRHNLICTGTTGRLVEETLSDSLREREVAEWRMADGSVRDSLCVKKLKSGPLGGDQQLGSMIVDGKIDVLIFFWDPMEPQPHDVDVKALLRIAVVYNVPTACNRSSADFIISSPLINDDYSPVEIDFSTHLNRAVV